MEKIVDLFAGCGGLSLGFQNAGFEIIGAFELWEVAVACYRKNFKHPIFCFDLSNVSESISKINELGPDIIIGGPPCQDFSHAGKRVEAGRATLTGAFAEIVTGVRPSCFVMENVDRAQKSAAYALARKTFKEAGYGLTEITLDASLCGVPQKRKRFFCIGSLGQNDGSLADCLLSQTNAKATTLRDFFGNTLDFEFYYRHPRNYNRRAIFSIDEPAPTIRGVNRPVPRGYRGQPNDACALDDSIRSLTTLERALIQTFPADFKWEGAKTDMEQMIGNAVPVKLAEFVAKALRRHIDRLEEKTVDYKRFASWLDATQSFSVKTKRDIISRLKRADSICRIPRHLDAYYVFQLEQSPEYNHLSSGVRSHLKRAFDLYAGYCESHNLR